MRSEDAPLEVEQQPGLTERPRRFSIFRRGGDVAIRGSVNVVTASEALQDDEESGLFGLEADLTEFRDLWSRHFAVATDFLEDETNTELFRALIEEGRGQASDRKARRNLDKLQDRDFERFAAIYIAAGRVQNFSLIYKGLLHDLDAGKPIDTYRRARDDKARMENKRLGLLGYLKQTPSTQEFQRRLAGLESQSHSTYKPVVKKEMEILKSVEQQTASNPANALRLVETFLEAAESELLVEKDFAALFANDYITRRELSVLGVALNTLRLGSTQGAFAVPYIERRLGENSGNNLLAFMSRLLTESGITTDVTAYLANQFNSWPSELSEDHEQDARELLDSYTLSVGRQSERNLRKAWLHPDLAAYEEDIDRLFLKVHPGGYSDKRLLRPRAAKGSQLSRSRMSTSDVLALDTPEQEATSLDLAVLTRIEGGFLSAAEDSLETVIGRVLDRSKRDPAFVEELKRVVERLRRDPFGSGVRSLRSVNTKDVDGNQRKIYRASPMHMTDMPVSKRTKNARVIFAVTGGKLAIYDIPTDHKEYDEAIIALAR